MHLTLSLATASLWASAFVLAAMIVVQAGRADFGHNAIAEMASAGTEYAMMTTKGGNEELLYVLDKRIGQLFVYEAVFGGGGDMKLNTAVNVGEMIAKRSRGTKK